MPLLDESVEGGDQRLSVGRNLWVLGLGVGRLRSRQPLRRSDLLTRCGAEGDDLPSFGIQRGVARPGDERLTATIDEPGGVAVAAGVRELRGGGGASYGQVDQERAIRAADQQVATV